MCYFCAVLKIHFSASVTDLEDLYFVKSHLFKNNVDYDFLKLSCDNFV